MAETAAGVAPGATAAARAAAVPVVEQLGRLAGELGRPELAALLRDELARPTRVGATVVVVGETKSGKSSVVNALLGRPGLSPVDADVATSCHLAFRYGPGLRACVQVGGGTRDVAPGDLAEWAAVGGSRASEPDLRGVEVALDHPLLEAGLTLVDTPGVGGLHPSHAATTLAALGQADALLFVADANAPLRAPEVRFLEQASERVATVVFVLNKVDLYPGWRTVLEDDRGLLARHAPRFGGSVFLPVSSRLKREADLARDQGDAELADELLAESGVPELEAALRTHVLQQAERLTLRNLIQLCLAVIGRVEALEQARVGAGDGDLGRRLEEAQARRDRFTKDAQAWPVQLSFEFARLDLALATEFNRLTGELTRRYDELLAGGERDVRESLPERLEADLTELAAQMELRFAQGVARIVDRTVEALGLDEADLRLAELHGAPRTSAPAPLAAPVATSDPGAERPPSQVITSAVMLTNMGGGLGAMAAAQLSVATALGAVSGGGLGLVFAAVTARALRRQQQERAARGQAVKFVQQTLGPTARERVHTPLKERLLDVRQALDATLRRCAERRGAELGDALTEQKRLRNASALERQRTAREAAGRLALLGQWRGELQRLDSGLRAGTEG